MTSKYLKIALVCSAAAMAAQAQTFERRAVLTGGNPADGRCVVEVTVDGTAEIEVRHENLVLRNLKGQTPELRRFECSAPMPGHPMGFRFAGVRGRGKQELLQSADGSGVAVIRIDDPQNGAGQYAFELRWNGEMAMGAPMAAMPVRPMRFGTDEAVNACQDYVRDQVGRRRLGEGDVVFRRAVMDDQPGRSEWVKGFFELRGRMGQPRAFQFSCSVDFGGRLVRSADIQPMDHMEGAWGDPGQGRAIQACEASVEQRLTGDGHHRIDFGSVRVDERPGRNEFVVGAATIFDRDRPEWFDFSCAVNMRDGTVRSADVTRR